MEKTFILAYPRRYVHHSIGRVVTEFELSGLNITGMICMDVTKDFVRKHLENIGWDSKESNENIPFPFRNWVYYLSYQPPVAMIVEGVNCIGKVRETISVGKYPLWVGKRETVYTSKSIEQAEKDIGLWFGSVNVEDVVNRSTKILFMLPKGVEHGPSHEVIEVLKIEYSWGFSTDLRDNFFMEDMCVILIKPLAFQNRCVGEILDAIEANCMSLRGLKLVKKADYPSKAWLADSDASSKPDSDEYGVAMVVEDLESSFRIVDGDPNFKHIDRNNKVFEIGSNYLHKSKSDQEVLDAAADFFDFGFCVWAFPEHYMLGGCMFQASLIGLTSLK